MGTSMTMVTVHLGDVVSYYKPPVCVMEILTEHPDYVVVSMRNGKRIILSSGVKLCPGRNYYLVSPDFLFSAKADDSLEIHADHALSCCSRGYDRLYWIAKTLASTKSLLAKLISKRKGSKTKSSLSMVIQICGAGQQSGRKRALIINDHSCTDVSYFSTSLAPDHAPAPAFSGALSEISERSSLRYEEPQVWTPAVRCSSPELLPLGHGMVAKVDEVCSSKKPCTYVTANAGSELGKESSVPWRSVKKHPEEPGAIVSQALSKDKWLQDMIRGADNQWNRSNHQGCGIELL